MSIKALQDYTFYSKYARYNQLKSRRETWSEVCDRVEGMHLRQYPQAEDDIRWAFEFVRKKKALGSQRILQFGGEPCENKHARVYNCSASHCDRIRFFQECFWLLLCGCGTGFSVQKHHVAKLPSFCNQKTARRRKFVFQIPDTIEGWADALGILMATYFPHSDFVSYSGSQVLFDYSQIRPEGAPLMSGVGKAPGPEPLRKALENIRGLLDRCLLAGQERLRPIDAYDIVMHACNAVLAGGVRRSATIAIFSPDDHDMVRAKTGDWLTENPQRARSNNSVCLLRNQTDKSTFLSILDSIKEFGEPGFYWTDSTENVPNPCVEISMWPVDEQTGETGWQFCNLSEINGGKIKTKEDFIIAARAASIIGTLQAGYTNFPYLGEITERITRREALLGVSITGMMDNPTVLFNPDFQREAAEEVLKTNERIAAKIGINPCARGTCIKPSGTASCLLGTASGIHPHHAKRYFRRVQANRLEPVLGYFKKFNAQAVEKSVWGDGGKDEVITFCVEVPVAAKTKNDLSATDLLEYVRITQQNWVSAGKRSSHCTQPWLNHNVSNTINVRPHEWDAVGDFIYDFRQHFAGIALIPSSGDLDYDQAPMVNVMTDREILAEYGHGSLLASGLIVDGSHYFQNLWVACYHAIQNEPTGNPDKDGWIARVQQFAVRYLAGDVRKTTYLLKHVHNWKVWLDLNREYKDVDYSQFFEADDNTTAEEMTACAGGQCDIQ